MTKINWQWYRFEDLTPSLLYGLLKLRQDVFILEQQCFYSDLDNQDQFSEHLLGMVDGQVLAYLRVIPKQIDGADYRFIGRVLTDASLRGQGAGRVMMDMTLAQLAATTPESKVQLSAQHYLQDFYSSLGFQPISEPYDEDGIMHIDMLLESD